MERAAGILMAITSLPSDYGIGTIGKEAYKFADFLKAAGQSYWQILPVGPISYGDSPYQSFSTYAGNPYLIDLDMLAEEGLLKKSDYRSLDWGSDPERVDYGKIYENRFNVLRIAYENHKKLDQTAFKKFVSENEHWIENYALYMAVKKSFGMVAWTQWPDEAIRLRKPEAVKAYKEKLLDDVLFYEFMQFLFFRQWEKFRGYVNSLGIQLFGDMPIYVAMDSADTWANPEVFWLDEERLPVRVAGCPPDYFSATGQLWGNPLYDWEYLKKTDYAWWVRRVAAAAKLFDVTRIDHFRGFDEYYSIPYGAKDAVIGDWLKGPGMDLFNVLKRELGELPIIAEDLGLITPGVAKLLKESGYPGMKVLQFAFDDRGESVYLPHMHTNNYVVYTGTHDNDTTMGWFNAAAPGEKQFAIDYCRLSAEEGYNWGLIRTGYASVADLFIAPMQDVLGLGSEARMNIPSTLGGNWQWRMKKGANVYSLAKRLKRLCKLYSRLPAAMAAGKTSPLLEEMELLSKVDYNKPLEALSAQQLHNVVGKAVLSQLDARWKQNEADKAKGRRAWYFSAEYLMGRMVYNNLYALDLLEEMKGLLEEKGIDIAVFEDIEDDALGNGGLGRLAACFLDSAATLRLPLDGYGIRYKYGLFKQVFEDGFQRELPDDWQKYGDPWSLRREDEKQLVAFADAKVWAVPYDMPIIGAKGGSINTLRLWQAEPLEDFDFDAFNRLDYPGAVRERTLAETISAVLYPNDNGEEGKRLRLRQQYFFCSASVQDMVRRYKLANGGSVQGFAKQNAVQLNDTHPIVAIPELIRVLLAEGMDFDEAFAIAKDTFSFTNHTIMGEALERWNVDLFKSLLPEIYDIVVKIDQRLRDELTAIGGYDEPLPGQEDEEEAPADPCEDCECATCQEKPCDTCEEEDCEDCACEDCLEDACEDCEAKEAAKLEPVPKKKRTKLDEMSIIDDGSVKMANLAIYAGSYVNGVAQIHTQILKDDTFKDWYALYPEKFQNKTNGITQRRWLALCNPELSELITQQLGDGWITDLDRLKELESCLTDQVLSRFIAIKKEKKRQLCDFILKQEGVQLDPSFVFDVQIKRLHEYKRQLLNAFSILDIYRRIKSGEIQNFTPTVFLFGAKAAPGYERAKGIIKYCNELAKTINEDPAMDGLLKVIFVHNYNCSYAEKLIPAADISEQISAVGTEASGTGNMKMMLNGAVTLGTHDGANIEIEEAAGAENNYLFGDTIDTFNQIKEDYDPIKLYEASERLASVVDSLVDGSFSDGGTGWFQELHDALLKGASWHAPDHYYVLYDFQAYVDKKLEAIADTRQEKAFAKKCLMNVANAGKFSSDRTIRQYAQEIWKL